MNCPSCNGILHHEVTTTTGERIYSCHTMLTNREMRTIHIEDIPEVHQSYRKCNTYCDQSGRRLPHGMSFIYYSGGKEHIFKVGID